MDHGVESKSNSSSSPLFSSFPPDLGNKQFVVHYNLAILHTPLTKLPPILYWV